MKPFTIYLIYSDDFWYVGPSSPERRAKQSGALTGRTLTPEHRAKISAAMRGHKNGVGRVQSAETRAKISAAMKARTVCE